MGEETDQFDEGPGCAPALIKAWKGMPLKERPKRAATLIRILNDAYAYPYPDFVLEHPDITTSAQEITDALNSFISAARTLREKIPISQNWSSLSWLVTRDMHDEHVDDKFHKYFAMLERAIPRIAEAPISNIKKQRGAPIKRPALRVWVLLICWYVTKVEGQPIAISNDAIVIKNRLGKLLSVTLHAMGIEVDEIDLLAEMRHAKNQNLADKSLYDLIPVLPPGPETGRAQ